MIETSTPGSGVVIVLPWDKLLSEFQLNDGQDWLNVAAKVSIIEQVGYGSLIQLNTRLAVHGNVLLVNKYVCTFFNGPYVLYKYKNANFCMVWSSATHRSFQFQYLI
jgi:hypothetical protein